MTFDEWWGEFKSVNPEWRFADSGALLKAAFEAGVDSEIVKRWEGNRIASEEARQELATETNNKQEFERDWLECCNRLNDERIANREEESVLNGKLAAAQAREKVLRNALETLYVDRHGNQFRDESDCEKALAQPTDDTALRAALEAERERCAKVCDEYGSAEACANAIRALEDE